MPAGHDSINIDADTEAQLARAGYIIGQLQRVIFYELGVKETNWSVTPVTGVDGRDRRWVYLHYFKAGQPSINWLDPSFAGMRLVIGDACHSLADLGAGALRLDANGFLGAGDAEEGPGWSEGHPLSEAANHLIASVVRKMGGFTFQELNLAIDDIKATGESGADLSYDFITRPAYHHALVTGDTEFLRLTMNLARAQGVDTASLVHAMQNHDELTFELIHFALHKDDEFDYGGTTVRGEELGDRIRADLTDRITGSRAPYNRTFTTNGIACTTASVITAALGIRDLDRIDDRDIETITRVHLMLAMYNALQPGVFALSGWDLLGILPVPIDRVESLTREGDTRHQPGCTRPDGRRPGLRRIDRRDATWTHSLYATCRRSWPTRPRSPGDCPNPGGAQAVRHRDRPTGGCARRLAPRAAGAGDELAQGQIQATVLNFAEDPVAATVQSACLTPGATVVDLFDEERIAVVDELHSFPISLPAFGGTAVALRTDARVGSVI